MSAPHQRPNQQTRKLPVQLDNQLKDQSFVFEIPHVSSGKPVPRVVGESSDLNCGRKRKHGNLDLLSGGLLDMLQQSQDQNLPVRLSMIPQEVMIIYKKRSLMNHENVSSVDCGMVLESERDEMQITSLDDNSSGNIKTTSVSLADCEMVSESENSETRVTSLIIKIGQDLGISRHRVYLQLDIIMGSDFRENAETHITSCGTNSSGSGSKNMNIPSGGSISKGNLKKAMDEEKEEWVTCDICHTGNIGFVVSSIPKQIKRRKRIIFVLSVSEAVDLVVRVVVSVDKELEVKQQFRDIFGGKNYPEKLKYRTKIDPFVSAIRRLDTLNIAERGFATCYTMVCTLLTIRFKSFTLSRLRKTPKEKKLGSWYEFNANEKLHEGIVVAQ
ncbi:hypothetical protein Tco_0922921 [Tanacetum coccineum]|uniref:histone acetyltransferase n=1 Tax=Tanacetum coccineum TaxID=301880 RepID=A0ABQ5D0V4_9ASTR